MDFKAFPLVICALWLVSQAPVPVEGQRKQCTVNCKRTGQPTNVTCALDPESVEGPFYLPVHLLRRNITEDRQGIPLHLNLTLVDSNNCEPVKDATVDIWHADAAGAYSGFVQTGAATPETTFLRGIQVTDAEGDVSFDTIYPGWYPGRCIHIHVEVFIGGTLKHVGQLYFQEELTEASRKVQPYAARDTAPLSLAKDGIYSHDGGADTTFNGVQGDAGAAGGLVAAMYIGIDPTATAPKASGRRKGGRRQNSNI